MTMQALLDQFTVLLFAATVFSGAIFALDALVLAPRRARAGRAAVAAPAARPAWVEYTGGLFPVIAAVFVLRSFVVEPFEIPSESMLPTLVVGDRILVNKFSWGVRLPILDRKIIETGQPARGDVMVFHSPREPGVNLVKRVVGLPGDRIVYAGKRLSINGVPLSYAPLPGSSGAQVPDAAELMRESLGAGHRIALTPGAPAALRGPADPFEGRELCSYDSAGFACTVPAGHYFTLGDNRDNSFDSRYWGFVPDRNIVGKAMFVWMNLNAPGHIGTLH